MRSLVDTVDAFLDDEERALYGEPVGYARERGLYKIWAERKILSSLVVLDRAAELFPDHAVVTAMRDAYADVVRLIEASYTCDPRHSVTRL